MCAPGQSFVRFQEPVEVAVNGAGEEEEEEEADAVRAQAMFLQGTRHRRGGGGDGGLAAPQGHGPAGGGGGAAEEGGGEGEVGAAAAAAWEGAVRAWVAKQYLGESLAQLCRYLLVRELYMATGGGEGAVNVFTAELCAVRANRTRKYLEGVTARLQQSFDRGDLRLFERMLAREALEDGLAYQLKQAEARRRATRRHSHSSSSSGGGGGGSPRSFPAAGPPPLASSSASSPTREEGGAPLAASVGGGGGGGGAPPPRRASFPAVARGVLASLRWAGVLGTTVDRSQQSNLSEPGGTAMFGAQEDIISPQFTKENSRFVRSYGTEEENGKNRKSATRFDQFKQKGLARFRRFMFLDLKVGAGLEKATVCFILQSFLYGAVLQVRPDNNRDDLAGESDRHVNYRHVTSVTILTFTFIYALKKGLQGLPNNCLFLFWAGSLKEKFLLLQNLWINFVLPIFLPYLTALFLRDAKSLGDVILNSVAIYFMIELDDEMVFQEDLNVLQDDLVFTYLDIMRTAATRRGQAARPRLDLERFLIRLATVASFVCLALAIFCYFRGSPLEWFVDQVNKDGDTPQPASQATEEGGVDGAPYPPPRHHFL